MHSSVLSIKYNIFVYKLNKYIMLLLYMLWVYLNMCFIPVLYCIPIVSGFIYNKPTSSIEINNKEHHPQQPGCYSRDQTLLQNGASQSLSYFRKKPSCAVQFSSVQFMFRVRLILAFEGWFLRRSRVMSNNDNVLNTQIIGEVAVIWLHMSYSKTKSSKSLVE